MTSLLIVLFIGIYIGVAIPVLLIHLCFAALGGREEDLFKAFIYSIFWLPALLIWIWNKL